MSDSSGAIEKAHLTRAADMSAPEIATLRQERLNRLHRMLSDKLAATSPTDLDYTLATKHDGQPIIVTTTEHDTAGATDPQAALQEALVGGTAVVKAWEASGEPIYIFRPGMPGTSEKLRLSAWMARVDPEIADVCAIQPGPDGMPVQLDPQSDILQVLAQVAGTNPA
jgi:hypothetical protein